MPLIRQAPVLRAGIGTLFALLAQTTLACAQDTHLPPRIDHWKSQSEVHIDDSITINGHEITFPHLGKFNLDYYGSFPGQENQIAPDVYRITPANGQTLSAPPFCASKQKPNEGYITLLSDRDVLDKPVLVYTALEPAFVPPQQDSGKAHPLQTCEQVTFFNPHDTSP